MSSIRCSILDILLISVDVNGTGMTKLKEESDIMTFFREVLRIALNSLYKREGLRLRKPISMTVR